MAILTLELASRALLEGIISEYTGRTAPWPTAVLFSWLVQKKRTSGKGTQLFLMATTSVGEMMYFKPTEYSLNYYFASDAIVKAASVRTSFRGVRYSTMIQNVTGLLAPGSTGVNHGIPLPRILTLLC
jgi:hypothetical protein